MDRDGECVACQSDKEYFNAAGEVMPAVILTMDGITYAFTTRAHARHALLEDPQHWAAAAVNQETGELLKKRGEVIGDLPTQH